VRLNEGRLFGRHVKYKNVNNILVHNPSGKRPFGGAMYGNE
jgi:hypothetical protein